MLHYQNEHKLSDLQLELLKVLKYQTTPQSLDEIRSLLRFYFVQKLDVAIEKAESRQGYTKAIYESWLQQNSASATMKKQ